MSKSLFRKIAQSKLGVSEPNPSWFGNPSNEAKNPNWTNANWLKSRFHFSFAEYSNPHNTNFGILRVLNDDLVQPNRGFGEHPHRDAEICTYVVQGELSHQDSMGTEETLGRGAVQFMTAGRGVSHSEHNHHLTNPLRFIQIWITPSSRGLKPNYGSFVGDAAGRLNQWQHLVGNVLSNKKNDNNPPTDSSSDSASTTTTSAPAVEINQDANIFVTEVDANRSVSFTLEAGRQAYLLCVEGNGRIIGDHDGEESLTQHDAAEVYGPNTFTIHAPNEEKAHFLMVEMAFTGKGRTDL